MWFCMHQCEALKCQTNLWICKLDFNGRRLDCKPLNKTFDQFFTSSKQHKKSSSTSEQN
jgi:hypothetical protein